MIPKKIHYCWFGRGEKPKLAKKCIASWKKYCPDYEIIEWNEDNFDVRQNAYMRSAYDQKKFAFVSDYARLVILYEEGGIYFDTDVELLKPIDDLLGYHSYFGFEDDTHINTGLGFGAEKHNEIVKQLLTEYDQYLDKEGEFVGCPTVNTDAIVKAGLQLGGALQDLGGNMVYPQDYFNPYDDPTGRLNITENTYSIHWYAKSWMSKKTVLRSKLTRPLHRMFGKDAFRKKG